MTVLVLVVALFFAIISTPLVRQLALNLDFVARPKADRAHQVVTPLMGGVAIYASLIMPMILFGLISLTSLDENLVDGTLDQRELFIIIISSTLMAMIGLRDDWKAFRPRFKFLLQVPPVLLLILTTEVKIALPLPEIFNLFLTLCWFLYVINAFNYLDNMDGVSSMVAGVAAMFFTVIAVITGQILVAGLSAAVAGTCFGFLRYNLFLEEKKIFMGDSGSLFLGFLLAVLGIKLKFASESAWVTWPVPVLVMGIPLFDTALVFISRVRRGQHFLQGGVDHTSHRLARMGLGRYGVPLGLGLIGTMLGCAAIMIMHSDLTDSIQIQIIFGLIALYTIYRLEFAASYEFRTGKKEGA